MDITLKRLTPDQAARLFPGCLTDDVMESEEQNKVEEGYHTLSLSPDGTRLLSSCYEISFISWAVWDPGIQDWRNLEDADWDLYWTLHEADSITYNDRLPV